MPIMKVFSKSFFLNPLDLNTNNIVKDIFIILTEDRQKMTPGHQKVQTLQKPV